MPKKFKGENSKSVEAKLRKNAAKEAEAEKKKQAEEEEFWRDDDKNLMKKQQRKDEREKKKQESQEKKQQLKEIYTDEMAATKTIAKSQPTAKITRAKIEENVANENHQTAIKKLSIDEEPLEENPNRLNIDGEEARNIDEAITLLSFSEEKSDRHPEKRMKAAYKAFEDDLLPQLKIDYPTMRLSQLKQMLQKEWTKSPQNPLNQNT